MLEIIAPPRGTDAHGSGEYGAPRGSRLHNGEDFGAYPGSVVKALTGGELIKIGYPYNPNDQKKGHLRYVRFRHGSWTIDYFYVGTKLTPGTVVEKGDPIGWVQNLMEIYPGMTNHIHFQCKRGGDFVNPQELFTAIKQGDL